MMHCNQQNNVLTIFTLSFKIPLKYQFSTMYLFILEAKQAHLCQKQIETFIRNFPITCHTDQVYREKLMVLGFPEYRKMVVKGYLMLHT